MPSRNQFDSEESFKTALRDWFAGQATEQDIEMHTGGEIHPKSGGIINGRTREQAKYAYADAMLAAREVKP